MTQRGHGDTEISRRCRGYHCETEISQRHEEITATRRCHGDGGITATRGYHGDGCITVTRTYRIDAEIYHCDMEVLRRHREVMVTRRYHDDVGAITATSSQRCVSGVQTEISQRHEEITATRRCHGDGGIMRHGGITVTILR